MNLGKRSRLKHTDGEFDSIWLKCNGDIKSVCEETGMSQSSVMRRRRSRAKYGTVLQTVPRVGGNNSRGSNGYGHHDWQAAAPKWPKRRDIELRGGSVIIGSDAHLWPDMVTTAWAAFEIITKREKPKYGILNGDTLDGAKITRHDPIAWETLPSLEEEISECEKRTKRLKSLSTGTDWYWTCGNHDTRYERYLAKNAPEMRGVRGSCLQHHIGWPFSWSIMFNGTTHPLMVKHAFRGGIHAVYNNTLHSGISIVTGHLHAQLIRPFTDYRGTRYGIDAGTLADIDGPQFHYTMDAPVNWRSGFVFLTLDEEGRLLPPETCEVQTLGKIQRAVFRGRIIVEREKPEYD